MKSKNGVKLALVAAALCGVDTTNVFATFSDVSNVSGISQQDVQSTFNVIKTSLKKQMEECEKNKRGISEVEVRDLLSLKERNFDLADMAEQNDKIEVPDELKKYVKLFSMDVSENKKLYIGMYRSNLLTYLFQSNKVCSSYSDSRLLYSSDFSGNYEGNAWFVNNENEQVSLKLQLSAMNQYYAVQAIKNITDNQQSDLELMNQRRIA